MTSLVVDTHSTIWYLNESPRLSNVARRSIRSAINAGFPVYISSVTIVEVTYLVEKGRLNPQQLSDLLTTAHRSDSGFLVQPFDLAIAECLSDIPRSVIPDMPDRMIAATALHLGLPLVTVDNQIQQSVLETIW